MRAQRDSCHRPGYASRADGIRRPVGEARRNPSSPHIHGQDPAWTSLLFPCNRWGDHQEQRQQACPKFGRPWCGRIRECSTDAGLHEVLLNAPLRVLPVWLADLLVATEPKRARTDGLTGTTKHSLGGIIFKLSNAQEGTRDDMLYWSAQRATEMPARKQRSALRHIRRTALEIGLPATQIERTITSAFGGRRA